MNKIYKIIAVLILLTLFPFNLHSEEKLDCSKINKDTVVGGVKYLMCKRNSDKLDKDGNFKKGIFNIFKKDK